MSEVRWWQTAYCHIAEARMAAVNAVVHNVDDPTKLYTVVDKLDELVKLIGDVMYEKGIPCRQGIPHKQGVP